MYMQIFFHIMLEEHIFRTLELLWKAKVSKTFESTWSENLLIPNTWITRLEKTVLSVIFGVQKTGAVLIYFQT